MRPPAGNPAAKLVTGRTSLSRAGAVLGTPGNMPPEQARVIDLVDERADVFALGERLEAARAAAAAGRIDRALDWVEADLSELRSLAETGSPPLRFFALRTIDSWRKDSALAPLRDGGRSERAGRFWAAVDVALAPPAKR